MAPAIAYENKLNSGLGKLPLTSEEIIEFKQIAKEDYGVDLTDEEAVDQAMRAIMLGQLLDNLDVFEALEKPNKKEQTGGSNG